MSWFKKKEFGEDLLLKEFPKEKLYVSNGTVKYLDTGGYGSRYKWSKEGMIKLSIGRVRSRSGDYLMGDYDIDFILNIFIDRDLIIQDIQIKDIYNPASDNKKIIEKSKNITKDIKIGETEMQFTKMGLRKIYEVFSAPYPTPIAGYLRDVTCKKNPCWECECGDKQNLRISIAPHSYVTIKRNERGEIVTQEWDDNEQELVEYYTKMKFCPYCGGYLGEIY